MSRSWCRTKTTAAIPTTATTTGSAGSYGLGNVGRSEIESNCTERKSVGRTAGGNYKQLYRIARARVRRRSHTRQSRPQKNFRPIVPRRIRPLGYLPHRQPSIPFGSHPSDDRGLSALDIPNVIRCFPHENETGG